jgi:hypothetical protein
MFRPFITVLAALACLYLTAVAYADDVPTMSPDRLVTELMTSHPPLILDVRSAEEFAEGHLPGAVNVAYTDLEKRFDQFDQSQDIVVYCVAGIRAAKALKILQSHGFSHLWHLDGDYAGWVNAGRRIEGAAASTAH